MGEVILFPERHLSMCPNAKAFAEADKFRKYIGGVECGKLGLENGDSGYSDIKPPSLYVVRGGKRY